MTRHDVATVRRLKTGLGILLALIASACATSRPSGSSPPGAAPAVRAQTPATPATAVRRSTTSKDGTRIAFDVAGTGPPLMMLHGGGQISRSWEERGYITRLKTTFTVITLDQRGSGDSGRPSTPAGYALDRLLEDVLAVADAANAPKFHLWGFGHGATVARYLAARSDRVQSALLVSTTMGAPLDGAVKSAVAGMRAKWLPVIEAQAAGTLDPNQLSPSDRTAWDAGIAPLASFLIAIDGYPVLEPAEIKVPTLWLVGAADTTAAENVKAYEGKLAGTKVTLKLLAGATYTETFSRIDLSLTEAVPFFTAHNTGF